MNIIIVKTPEGKIRYLPSPSCTPPLRLCATRPQSSPAATLPGDLIRRVLFFLTPQSQDWLSADSTCRAWCQAAVPLWNGQRARVAQYCACQARVAQTWRRLYGFLRNARVSLHGPASAEDMGVLEQAVHPWKLPHALRASLEMHDGEVTLRHGDTGGLYLGARLWSAREIAETTLLWRRQYMTSQEILLIPLFSERGARQVAMELHRNNDNLHGRVVFASAAAPWAPHFRVLAANWQAFLTLV